MRNDTILRRVRRRPGKTQSQKGFVLIDALVGIVIFMLGVVGMLGLQTTLTHAQTEAKYRADAAFLAADIIGRMWSDTASLNTYVGTSGVYGAGCLSEPRCREWFAKIDAALPGGKGTLAVNPVTGDVAVSVSWTMPNSGDTHKYTTNTTITKAGN